jgi:hypothetical protein
MMRYSKINETNSAIPLKIFQTWEIIDLMNTRVKRTIGTNIKIDSCIFLIKNLEEIALKMPKI